VFVYGVAYLVLPERVIGLIDGALEIANPLTQRTADVPEFTRPKITKITNNSSNR
jgi:hypothetical protein